MNNFKENLNKYCIPGSRFGKINIVNMLKSIVTDILIQSHPVTRQPWVWLLATMWVRREDFIHRVSDLRGNVHAGLRTVSPAASSCCSCCGLPTRCFSPPFSREVQPLCLIRVLPGWGFLCSPATWLDHPVTIPIKTQQVGVLAKLDLLILKFT